MSSHLRMADEFSRMATQFQSATSAPTRFPQSTEQARGGGEPSTSNRPAGWSFMGNFNAADGGGRWVSESRSESWINGQRHTTHRRRDVNVSILINSAGFSFLFSFLFFPPTFFCSSVLPSPVVFLLRLHPLPLASSASIYPVETLTTGKCSHK